MHDNQTLHPDILEDLASLYLSGDASPATRALLEDHARANPAFAARLHSAQHLTLPTPPAPLSEDAEARALRETRQAIFLRTLFLAMGIAFALLPLAFTFGPEGVHFLFFPHQTGLLSAFWSIALASFVAAFVMRRAVARRGL